MESASITAERQHEGRRLLLKPTRRLEKQRAGHFYLLFNERHGGVYL